MTEQQNIQVIEELYSAFGRADPLFILDMVAEDVEWQHPRPSDIPWGGNRRGSEEVAQFFAAIGELLQVEEFSPDNLLLKETR